MPIHPTAIVDARAEIGPDVEIGPYAVLDGPVRLGRGTRVLAHAVVRGHTRLGADNVVHPGAVLGGEPQDFSYAGAESYVEIGDRNVFREGVSIHRGTKPGSATVIGSDCYFMGNSHAAHNCQVGDGVTLANGAVLGGYAEVGAGVFLGGNCAVHQFCRVGTLAILRGLSRTSRDVPPFCVMDWTSVVRGVNRVGLQRAGFSPERIRAVRRAFALLFGRRRNLRLAMEEVEAQEPSDDVRLLLDFIRASKRGVSRGPRAGAEED
jgi:UDP-N-acetylglucosamine acyltransferase